MEANGVGDAAPAPDLLTAPSEGAAVVEARPHGARGLVQYRGHVGICR